ncbi:hypothetical protein ACWEQ4_01345 [Rhodococcus sp. NPDC003994]
MPDMADLAAVLERNRRNDRDDDIWVVHKNGQVSILPDQDVGPLQDPATWPKYIGRAGSLNNLVRANGPDQTLDFINKLIAQTMATNTTLTARAIAAVGRAVGAAVAARA